MLEFFCPYVGLQPYTEDDRDYFFGRERDQRIIAANLYAAPLTILDGASGVGKSSVLLAGVVPYLRARPRTAVVVFREWQGASLLDSLKSECLKAVVKAQQKPLTVDAVLPLDEFLNTVAQAFGGSILLLFDQFEDYFLYHPEAETANTVDAEFALAINRDEIDAHFLIALREDNLSKLNQRFRKRIPGLLSNTLHLQHLNTTAAEAAIRKPLEVYNERFPAATGPVTIEDELVREIIAQVRTEQVSLSQSGEAGQAQTGDATLQIEEAPLLQLIMKRLWGEEMQADSRVLRLSTLQRLGGAKEIVRTHLDRVMAKLDTTKQEICSRFFDRLVTPAGNKIACCVADLTNWAEPLAVHVPSVLKLLSEHRILRSVAGHGRQQSDTWYEIYHDVLVPVVLDWHKRYVQEQKQAAYQRELQQAKVSAWRAKAVAWGLGFLFFAFGVFVYNRLCGYTLGHLTSWLLATIHLYYFDEPKMVKMPAGEFWMGSSDNDPEAMPSEKPRHRVIFSKPFEIGQYEITFEEYDQFVYATWRRRPHDSNWGRGRRPVINVTWDDAKAYADWLSEMTGKPYRLLSEAEWEYAARAGSETAWFWGNDPKQACQYGNVADQSLRQFGYTVAIFKCDDQYDETTAQVGSFPPNQFGLYDMLGNVEEWVQDCYHADYQSMPTDGSSWETRECSYRIARGGSWKQGPPEVRAAMRDMNRPNYRYSNLGFRLAKD